MDTWNASSFYTPKSQFWKAPPHWSLWARHWSKERPESSRWMKSLIFHKVHNTSTISLTQKHAFGYLQRRHSTPHRTPHHPKLEWTNAAQAQEDAVVWYRGVIVNITLKYVFSISNYWIFKFDISVKILLKFPRKASISIENKVKRNKEKKYITFKKFRWKCVSITNVLINFISNFNIWDISARQTNRYFS